MSADITPQTPDITPIMQLVRKTRTLLRSSWVLTGLGLTVGLLLGTLVAVTTMDLLIPLDYFRSLGSGPRFVALLIVVVPAGWALLVGVILPLLRRLAAGEVARRIETHLPGIHNRLVSCIDLSANQQPGYSPAFYRRLVTEALERIRGFRPSTVIDRRSLKRASLFAVVSTSVFVLALCLFSDRLPTALARVFAPFADIPPASDVAYTVQPGNAKVLRGEDVPFLVQVEKGEPKQLWIELYSPDGSRPLRYDLKPERNQWKVTLNSSNIGAGFENAFSYRVFGGGTWSKRYDVQMVERPSIASLHTAVHYPAYMGIAEPRVGQAQMADVSGPEGSEVEVIVQAEGNVKEAEIQWVDRVWFEDKLPAGAQSEGNWKWDHVTHQKPCHTEPATAGTHSRWFLGAAEGFVVQAGESLFTYVYIVPGQEPETIRLQWHDGNGWDHKAYWGTGKIQFEGKTEGPGRVQMGALPESGKWVRLEVPAEKVNLTGKTLRGMDFTLVGGQCYWHRAGAVITAGQTTFAMQPRDDNQWAGKFKLERNGFYRVQLKNELGHTNKAMKEASFVAVADLPPQIVLERPASDLVLSEPGKVPLVVAAFDDFGLAEVSLAIQRGYGASFVHQPIKRYTKPQTSDTIVTALDLPALQVKPGETLRYRVEARDRKGQTTRSQEYSILISIDKRGDDQTLAAFEKTQDPFRDKLIQLIAEQEKVRAAVEKLNDKYAPLMAKIREAEAKGLTDAPRVANPAKEKTPPAPSIKLDPEDAKLLDALRKELAELSKQEQRNTKLGHLLGAELAKSADQAANMPLMPRQIADEMRALQNAFQQMAVKPLQDLTNQMRQGADPRQGPVDLNQLRARSDRVQQEMEALKDRMNALADARKNMRDNVSAAIEQLKNEILRQRGGMNERELEDLKQFIQAMRREMNQIQGDQEKLFETTKKAPSSLLEALQERQAKLDKQLNALLKKTHDLQGNEKMRRMKRKPDFPDSPYTPETDEKRVRPKEEDTDEPLPNKKGDKDKQKGDGSSTAQAKGKNDKDDKEEEPTFMPALGGPKPKIDPRYADKQRPVERKAKNNEAGDPSKSDPMKGEPNKGDPDSQRQDLEARQAQQLNDLNQAEQSLASDEQSLQRMLNQLRQAVRASPKGQNTGQGEGQEGMQQLSQMMQSSLMQQAMAMAARMAQLRNGQGSQQNGNQGNPGQATTGNMQGGTPPGGTANEEQLNKLDLSTRTILLKMQPQLREELLQGMREAGPEGYQKFIQDYLKRLTEVKNAKSP